MEETKKAIAPDWWLVKIDERKFWREDIQAKTTAIYGVYAFDRSERTFCCELTPSYCLWFISHDHVEVDGLPEDERDELHGDILSSPNEPVSYHHVRSIEQLMKESPERFKKIDNVDPGDWNTSEELNQIVDYIAENWGTGALMF